MTSVQVAEQGVAPAGPVLPLHSVRPTGAQAPRARTLPCCGSWSRPWGKGWGSQASCPSELLHQERVLVRAALPALNLRGCAGRDSWVPGRQ